MDARAVILAAGTSSRMGRQKLLAPFRGKRMIDYVIDAARRWKPVIVASAPVAQLLGSFEDAHTIVNDEPERGMAHSLALADAALPAGISLIVLLADKPLITPELIERICDLAKDVDVAHPVHERLGEPGHPVVFSPRARAKIRDLPDGDTLKAVRDDPALTRRTLPTADPGAFFDVDTPEQLEC
jgi:molybdenum cofactor cytidylyltransferase